MSGGGGVAEELGEPVVDALQRRIEVQVAGPHPAQDAVAVPQPRGERSEPVAADIDPRLAEVHEQAERQTGRLEVV